MKNLSITVKLTIAFILFAGAILVGVSLPAYLSSRASLRDATISRLLSTAIEKQSALDAWNNDRLHSIEDIANQTDLINLVVTLLNAPEGSTNTDMAYSTLIEELDNWAGEGHRFLYLSVIDGQTGRIVASTNTDDEGKFVDNQPFFTQGKQSAFVENPYLDSNSQQVSMTAAAPLYSSDGRVVAVLSGPVNLAEMDAIIQRRTALHESDDAFLVNTSNLFVTQPHLISDEAVLKRGLQTEAVDLCLTHTSSVIEADDYRGVPAIIVYRWLPKHQFSSLANLT